MAEITDAHVILSLGASVQSTALTLMAVRGELPGFRPVAAVFADTGWEPRGVYDHLHWLVQELGEALPVHIVADRHPDGTPANIYTDTLALMAYRRERAPGLPVDQQPARLGLQVGHVIGSPAVLPAVSRPHPQPGELRRATAARPSLLEESPTPDTPAVVLPMTNFHGAAPDDG
jgi:hypothetical protein